MNTERKILCVEDDPDTCRMLTELLEGSGLPCKVATAHNTVDALELIEVESFDLYLLDTWMPEIGGLQLCKRIRKVDPITPIVFFTALASEPNRKRALEAGANEFVVKPDHAGHLIPTVKRLLGMYEEGVA